MTIETYIKGKVGDINSYLNELTGVINTSGSERDKELIEYLNNVSIEFEKLKLKVEETYIAG
jgi:hypothetical protein